MLPSLKRTRSAPRNSTRFAAQYPARGLPCERFAAGLATRLAHHSGPRRLARPFLAEDLHLLFFRQLDWRTQLRVKLGRCFLPPYDRFRQVQTCVAYGIPKLFADK